MGRKILHDNYLCLKSLKTCYNITEKNPIGISLTGWEVFLLEDYLKCLDVIVPSTPLKGGGGGLGNDHLRRFSNPLPPPQSEILSSQYISQINTHGFVSNYVSNLIYPVVVGSLVEISRKRVNKIFLRQKYQTQIP